MINVSKGYYKDRGYLSSRSRESAAIAICTTSVLQTRGKTLRKFSCKKGARVMTQKMKR
jgi:hypothetical protein